MPRTTPIISAFNGGLASKKALARTDLEVMPTMGVEYENYIPRARGEMQFRPGFERMGDGAAGRLYGVKFDTDKAAVIDFRDQAARFWNTAGEPVTRAAPAFSVTDGSFGSSAAWSLLSPGGSIATITSGQLELTARRYETPTCRQQITVAAGAHCFRITITRGPVRFAAGTTAGAQDLFGPSYLRTGVHDLCVNSSGSSFWIELASEDPNVVRIVDSIIASPEGALELSTPWPQSVLRPLNLKRNIDVHYACHELYQTRRIESRPNDSWSVALYESGAGPFSNVFSQRISMTLAATYGVTTLTSSDDYFTADMVGQLFELTHDGQGTTSWVSAADHVTDAVEITGGANDDRQVYVDIDVDGSWSGTIQLERAFGAEVDWSDWSGNSYTADADTSADETNDNSTVYVRARVSSYTAGSARVTLSARRSTTDAIVRVLSYTSPTEVSVEVVREASSTDATFSWRDGNWSDVAGWPAAVEEHDGRLFFGYGGRFAGSVSDDLESFDGSVEGDDGPIDRAIGGSSREVLWLLSMQRLLMGTGDEEFSVRASSFDEPLIPSGITVKSNSSVGSAHLQAVKLGSEAIFVDQDTRTLHVLSFDGQAYDYGSTPLDVLVEDLLQDAGESIVEIAIQRRPETRIWCLLSSGRLFCLVYQRANRVQGYFYVSLSLGHTIESVTVRPIAGQDDEIWIKSLRGSVRHTERMFLEHEARGGTANKMADCALHYSGSPVSQVTAAWLADQRVIGWADGQAIDPVRADSSGVIVLTKNGATISAGEVTVGLPYGARYRSTKLAYGAAGGSAVARRKQVESIAPIAADICLDGTLIGLEVGTFGDPTYERLVTPITPIFRHHDHGSDHLFSELDFEPISVASVGASDPRLVIEQVAPYPATFLGAVLDLETH